MTTPYDPARLRAAGYLPPEPPAPVDERHERTRSEIARMSARLAVAVQPLMSQPGEVPLTAALLRLRDLATQAQAADPKLTAEQALARAADEHPALVAQHRRDLAAARSGMPPGLHAHVTGEAPSQHIAAAAAKEGSRTGTSPGATFAETTLTQAARDLH